MTTKAFDVTPNALIGALAKELKANPIIKPPAWINAVKTGSHNERVPEQEDFWYFRCASILRTMFVNGTPVGVMRLRTKYGGRTKHTVHREHHRQAGGKVIRLAIQQLEKAGLLKKEKVGRSISASGKKLVEKAAKAGAA